MFQQNWSSISRSKATLHFLADYDVDLLDLQSSNPI